MQNDKKTTPYHPEKQLPAVHRAARQFHLVVLQWLQETRAPRSLVAPLGRATRRATIAIQIAGHSPSYQRHLRRAKEEMLLCLATFSTLTDEGHFSEEVGHEAERWMNQILIGIDQLAETPVDRWLQLKLPPLAPPEKTLDSPSRARRELEERVRAAANLDRLFPALRATVRRQPKRAAPPPPEESVTNERVDQAVS